MTKVIIIRTEKGFIYRRVVLACRSCLGSFFSIEKIFDFMYIQMFIYSLDRIDRRREDLLKIFAWLKGYDKRK